MTGYPFDDCRLSEPDRRPSRLAAWLRAVLGRRA
jgi:hypothetical protein